MLKLQEPRLPVRLALSLVAALAAPALAAPLPPLPPVDLCGRLVYLDWLPPAFAPAEPGFSGSIAVDRRWPGRTVAILANVCTDDAATVALANQFLQGSSGGAESYLDPGEALLVLPQDAPSGLTPGRTICVTGFAVSGDEGGTWTRFENLMQLPAALGEASLRRCAR